MKRRVRSLIPILLAVVVLAGAPRGAAAQDSAAEEARLRWIAPIEQTLREAKEMGAPKRCPRTYETAVAALQAASAAVLADPAGAGRGTTATLLESARVQAQRTLARIRFIEELREERNDWEAVALRYDRLVETLATVHDVALPPELAVDRAGRALIDSLSARRAAGRAFTDSLIFANRDLTRWVEADRAVRDTQVARLEEQITLLRHRLWESELRAGMAEADAGEAQMRAQRLAERQQRVRALADLFAPEEGEVLLTPDGDVRVRLTGLKFASGSHWLNPKYDPLLDKVAQVARTFPQARLTVEGHTDDAGSRATNQTLSLERARRVAAALAGRLEVPEDSLQVVGVGPDRPVAPNSTAEGRARNRRIEFLWETGEEPEPSPDQAADSP